MAIYTPYRRLVPLIDNTRKSNKIDDPDEIIKQPPMVGKEEERGENLKA